MDGGAWKTVVHGVAEGRTRLSDFPFTFHFPALEKEMATHSSVLAWRIPGTGEPGGLPSMGSHRVGHNWNDSAVAADFVLVRLGDSLTHCSIAFELLREPWDSLSTRSSIRRGSRTWLLGPKDRSLWPGKCCYSWCPGPTAHVSLHNLHILPHQ